MPGDSDFIGPLPGAGGGVGLPAPSGSLGGLTAGGGPNFPLGAEGGVPIEELSPQAGILRGLRQRLGTRRPLDTIMGRFLGDQPFGTAFGFANVAQVPNAPASLEQFAASANPSQVRNLSAQAFQGLATGGAAPEDIRQRFAQPQAADDFANLVALAQSALRSRLHPLAAGLLNQPSARQLQTEFTEQFARQPTANFTDFIRQRLLLKAFGI